MKTKRIFSFAWFLVFLFSFSAFSGDRYITVSDGQHIEVKEPISTVFVSDPEIVDYNVVNENTVVVLLRRSDKPDSSSTVSRRKFCSLTELLSILTCRWSDVKSSFTIPNSTSKWNRLVIRSQ